MQSGLQHLKLWIRAKNRQRLHRRDLTRGLMEESALRMPLQFEPPIALDATVQPQALRLPASDTPDISVIIPAYGDSAVTLRCLAALALHPPAAACEVIVIEDASGHPSVPLLEQVAGIRLIRNERNLGFLRSCNKAVALARAPYVLLLNNDTQVLAGALDALRLSFDQHPRAGLVGAKLLHADGRLQEAGGILWSNGSGLNHGRNADPREPAYNHVREVDFVSGAAMMLPAALWHELGGFDERYRPAYCEDADLAMSVRAAGRSVLYQPAAQVMHIEGVSCGTDANPGVKKYQYANRDKLAAKWKWTLEREHMAPNDANIPLACDRSRFRPWVLVTNDQIVEPDRDAGSRAIDQLLDALGGLGLSVKFWPDNPREGGHYAERLRQRGIETLTGPYRPAFEDWIKANGRFLRYAVMNRPPETQRYLELVRRHSDAWVVYYGHDLHHARLAAQAEVTGEAVLRASAKAMHEIESEVWQRANVSAYFAQEEVDEVLRECPTADARLVQPYCFDRIVRPESAAAGQRLLFVAGFGHPPNVDAASWLVEHVMPKVWAAQPQARLSLVGSKPTPQVLALAGERVAVTGYVSDEQLQAMYRQARVAVVPLRFGAGVKHKVVEALAEGVPLVTTPVGAQGLPWLDQACAVHADADAFAQAVIRLLRDDTAWLAAARQAADCVEAHFSRASLKAQVARLLAPR